MISMQKSISYATAMKLCRTNSFNLFNMEFCIASHKARFKSIGENSKNAHKQNLYQVSVILISQDLWIFRICNTICLNPVNPKIGRIGVQTNFHSAKPKKENKK